MKRLLPFLLMILGLVVTAALSMTMPAHAAPTVLTVYPDNLITKKGGVGGQPASNLAVMDQSGSDDNWNAYVTFTTPTTKYVGEHFFTLPAGVDPTQISAMQLQVNFRGPAKGTQAWKWKLYNWKDKKWLALGDNAAAVNGQWMVLSFSVPNSFAKYVSSSGQIRVKFQSNNLVDDADLDYEAMLVTAPEPPPPPDPGSIWMPTPGTSWQWQLSGTIDTSFDVDMYDVDMVDTPQSVIDQLHADGRVVICYFSAGSWENYRPDKDAFPSTVKGKTLDGWPDEKWLDIRQISVLGPIMGARLDLAVQKGCDGVEPDNIDGYTNDTGFSLSYQDQINYNVWLAQQAHARGLSIGLKNDLDQIPDLVDDFDWAINEQCFEYDECDTLLPFVAANKAVFGVEYDLTTDQFCAQANAMNFDWLKKNLDLDAERTACR
jgi:hypothetical protein